MKPPLIACLCPTFRRPTRLVANSVACFLNQTYPAARRKLVILDDSGELSERKEDNWSILSVKDRYGTLPEKYHALVAMAGEADAYCVWEDDDCFLPRHLEAHAMALGQSPWSHPGQIYVLTDDDPVVEQSGGFCHHSALAFTREAYEATGWPRIRRPNFDLQFLSDLRSKFGPPGDPNVFFGITYAFRWRSTGSYHGQHFMDGQNEDWWDRAASVEKQGDGRAIVPELDDETKLLYDRLGESYV